jgi:hypothetical protein
VRSSLLTKSLFIVALNIWLAGFAQAKAGSEHWASHGNSKWSRNTLTLGQARVAIAMAVANRLSANHTGLTINPRDIQVTLKVGADGKTAIWRAEALPRSGSPWNQMVQHGFRVDTTLQGTIDVALRTPAQTQIAERAQTLYQQRLSATDKTDWAQAQQQLSRFGHRPREKTVRQHAQILYTERNNMTAQTEWTKAERQLTLDFGQRVQFIDSSKKFHAAQQQLFGATQP